MTQFLTELARFVVQVVAREPEQLVVGVGQGKD